MHHWIVTPYEPSDLPKLSLYFKKHLVAGSQYGSTDLFQWRAVDNYVMPGIINLIKDGDQIVATLSNTPKKLFVNGEACIVAEIGDANTDPKYQRQGFLTLLTRKSTQDAFDKGIRGVYSTPSTLTPSLPAFITKANFQPQPGIKIRNLLFPLDIGPRVGSSTHWLVGRLVGLLYLACVHVYFHFRQLIARSTAFDIEECDALPGDWDAFWENAREGYEAIFDRSRRAIQWRYFLHPNRYQFLTARDKGVLVGYVVYRFIAENGNKRCVVADFLFLPGFDHCFNRLLLQTFKNALLAGAESISCWCIQGSAYDHRLQRFGFMRRSEIVLVWVQNAFAKQLKTLRGWHFTCGDSDNV